MRIEGLQELGVQPEERTAQGIGPRHREAERGLSDCGRAVLARHLGQFPRHGIVTMTCLAEENFVGPLRAIPLVNSGFQGPGMGMPDA